MRTSIMIALTLAASCGSEAPADDPNCPLDECGISCFDATVCGSCGNGTCDWFESLDVCPSDCCVPQQCDPEDGPRYEGGDGTCGGAPDGTRCDDGDLANGVEICLSGVCRHEHPHCRCMPPGGVFPEDPGPEPEVFEEPPVPADSPWIGDEPADPELSRQWGLRRVNVSEAWQHTLGAGVVVGVVDTGCVDTVPDLGGQVIARTDVVGAEPAPDVDGEHGTFLASIIASRADGTGMIGVAPESQLACARVVAGESIDVRAEQSDIAAGIDWAVANGARVILVGLTATAPTAELERAVAAALAADVVVVAPSGSAGGGHLDGFPAAYPGVLSVAGTDGTDLRDYGSDLSPETLLAAPGANIVGWHIDGEQGIASGSSVAAAYVAGAAALVRSAAPDLSAAQVRAILHARAAPIPMEGFDRVFRVRRLDVGRAVAAVVGGAEVHDVAVGRVAFAAPSALPGEPARARVRIENRGTVAATGVALSVAATGGTAESGSVAVADLDVGASTELELVVTADGTSAAIELSVTVTSSGDVDASNDARSVAIPVDATIHHRLEVARVVMHQPEPGASLRTVAITVENAGNVPEGASELRVLHHPIRELEVVDVPALASGERAELEVRIDPRPGAPEARHQVVVYQRPAPGQRDVVASSAWINYRWSDGENELAELAYMQLKGHRLVADAPWRTIRDVVPVMVFYPRTLWLSGQHPDGTDLAEIPLPGPAGGAQVNRFSIANPMSPRDSGPLVYEDFRTFTVRASSTDTTTRHSAPSVAPGGLLVVDESHVPVTSGKVVLNRPEQGAHRIAYIPTDALRRVGPCTPPCPDRRPDPNTFGAWLRAAFEYRLYEGSNQFLRMGEDGRTMFVAIGENDLPALHDNGHYFDPHYHTIAEYFPGTYLLGPAQKYGGPLAMLSASAWALGITDERTFEGAHERIITTDHNTFFDDVYSPWGPTHASQWPATSTTGSQEMDVYRALLGRTVGEEVSLRGELATAKMGRHSLLYDADFHVNGSWGTIDSFGGPGSPHCTPTLDNVLTRISGGFDGMGAQGECTSVGGLPDAQSGRNQGVVGGSIFAAHPYLGGMYTWSDRALHEAGALPPFNSDRFMRRTPVSGSPDQRHFAFRGLQFWNAREAQRATSSWVDYAAGNLRQQNPFVGELQSIGPWEPHCGSTDGTVPGYRAEQGQHITQYLDLVRDGLGIHLQEGDPPLNRFNRKLFAIAGSDGHGDFNWSADFLSTRIQNIASVTGMTAYSDSAFARPRTYVFDETDPAPRNHGSLDDLIHGRAVITDGPVVSIAIDAEARGRWNGGRIGWHDDTDEFEDYDGRIGGGGNLDGERTALVPYLVNAPPEDDDGQRMMLRTRCANTYEFGGVAPARYELWVTGAPGTDERPSVIDLLATDEPPSCDEADYDQVLDLDNISEPRAVMAHVQMGNSCPAIYDAWTNPIWIAPVKTKVPEIVFRDTDTTLMQQWCVEATDDYPEPGVFELEFPVSMMDEPVTALVAGVSTTGALLRFEGGVDGMGGLEPVVDGGGSPNGWFDSEDGRTATTRLRLRIPLGCAVMEDALDPYTTPARMILLVARRGPDTRLRDVYGNGLSIFLARFEPAYAEYIHDEVVVPGSRDFGVYHPMPPDDEAEIVESSLLDLATGAHPSASLFPGHTLAVSEGRRPGDPTHYGVHMILDGPPGGGGSRTWRYLLRWRRR